MIGRIPGPICCVRDWFADDIDDGTLMRRRSPFPCALGTIAPTPDPFDEKTEFALLKGKITDVTAEAYGEHRRKFFGTDKAYQEFAAESDLELDTDRLRRFIEFNKKGQEEAQKIFYRWVRKAYINDGVTDVPAQIRRGMSDDLKAALDLVKATYQGTFKSGGFNPRPKKDAHYRYRLGTISEHGTGNAIDIEDQDNPILSKDDWNFIKTLTGKTVDQSATKWKSDPKSVWKGIKDINDEFVKKVASEVKLIEDERAKAPATASAAKVKLPEPIDVVLKGHLGLKKWKDGFFTLDWELVEALSEHDFLWGATFYPGSVDLHHFELAD